MTTKGKLLTVMRQMCLRCCDGSTKEIQECSTSDKMGVSKCPIYPYRMGIDPNIKRSNKNLVVDKKSPSVVEKK